MTSDFGHGSLLSLIYSLLSLFLFPYSGKNPVLFLQIISRLHRTEALHELTGHLMEYKNPPASAGSGKARYYGV